MSHEATNWAIKQRGLRPIAKIVLWHLADCHNPVMGCFPTQGYLAEQAEIARSSVNRCLDELEAAGLIRRDARLDPVSKRQLPTRYRLACEKDFDPQDVVGRVPGSDTEGGSGRVSGSDTEIEAADCGEPAGEAVENAPSRVPETGGAVSDSYGTLTCKKPITPLPPEGDEFDLLVERWPEERHGNLSIARRVFDGLSPGDRAKATLLVDEVRGGVYQLGRPLPHLAGYLRDRVFAEFDGAPPIEGKHFLVTPDRLEWQPWLAHVRRRYGTKPAQRMAERGYCLAETRWPPTETPR